MRVACIGEAMVELSIDGKAAQLGVAGDTLNTAIYLKRCAPDLSVSYITRLGRDHFSDQVTQFMAQHEIDTGSIERSDSKHPGLYAITLDAEGERSFTYWRDQSAARDLFQSTGGPRFEVLEAFDLLYLSGITLAILSEEVREGLLSYLRHSPQKLAFDSNYRPALWADQKTAQHWVTAFWAQADIALPSIDDEAALFDETENQVRARFFDLGIEGALKQGAGGPLSLGPEVVVQSYPAAERVVDTTAAGDSFNGGYLAATLTGASQQDALMAGHNCAAHVVQHRGAIVPPG